MKIIKAAAVGAITGGVFFGAAGELAARTIDTATRITAGEVLTTAPANKLLEAEGYITRLFSVVGGAALSAVTAAAVTQNFNLALGETEPRDGNYPQ